MRKKKPESADRIRAESNVIVLDPKVAKYSRTMKVVKSALREIMQIAEASACIAAPAAKRRSKMARIG